LFVGERNNYDDSEIEILFLTSCNKQAANLDEDATFQLVIIKKLKANLTYGTSTNGWWLC